MVHVVNHRYAVRSHLAHASDKRCALSCGGVSFTKVTPAKARQGGAYEGAPLTPPSATRPLNTGQPCYLHSGRSFALAEAASAEAAAVRRKAGVKLGCFTGKADDKKRGDIRCNLLRLSARCAPLGRGALSEVKHFGPPFLLQLCAKKLSLRPFLVTTVRVFRLTPLKHKRLFVLAPDYVRQPQIKAPGLYNRGVHGTLGHLAPPYVVHGGDHVRTKHNAAPRDSWCLSTRYALSDGASVASVAERASHPIIVARSPLYPQPISLQYVRFAHEVLLGYTGNPHVAKLLRSLVSRFVGRRLQLRVTREALQLHRAKLSAPNQPSWPAVVQFGAPPQGCCLRKPLGDTRGEGVPFLGYLISHRVREPETRRPLRRCFSPEGGYLRPTDTLSAPKKELAHPRLRNKVRLLVNMPKVLHSLAEQGFCDRSGNPQPNFHYFQETQSNTVARVASVLRGLANYYHLAESQRRCVSRWSYILTHSLAMMFAAKFKLGTRAKVFAVAGRNLWKPLLAKSRHPSPRQ
jgi:Type II intron maturase